LRVHHRPPLEARRQHRSAFAVPFYEALLAERKSLGAAVEARRATYH
jgi:hypothetical protein